MSTLTRVDRPDNLTDLAYIELRKAVLGGTVVPDQVVSVVSLAADLGMSRSPVRAAIERLVSEGLMTLTPGGATISAPDRSELLEVLVVRASLEGLAARLAAPRLSAGDLRELRDLHTRFSKAAGSHDKRAAQRADLEFHQRIQASSGNAHLVDHLRRVQGQVILATYSNVWISDRNVDEAVIEHGRILDALKAGEGSAAGAAAEQHLMNLCDRLRAAWEAADVTKAD